MNSARALFLMVLAGTAHGAPLSSLEVRTNRPASVFIDGQPRGSSPIVIKGITPGVHNVKIVDDSTGFVKYKPFVAPADHSLDQIVNFEFQGGRTLTAAERAAQEKEAQRAPGAIAQIAAPPPQVQATVVPYGANNNYGNGYDPNGYYGNGYYDNGYYGGYGNGYYYGNSYYGGYYPGYYPYAGFGRGFGVGLGFGRGFRRGGFGGFRGGARAFRGGGFGGGGRGFRSGGFGGGGRAFRGGGFGGGGRGFRGGGFRSAGFSGGGFRGGGFRGGGRRR